MANPNPPSAAGANTDSNMESPGTWVDIGAASPLFAYEPQRNAPSGWSQDTNGGSSCSGGGSYAVGMNGLYCQSALFETFTCQKLTLSSHRGDVYLDR